MYNTIEIPELEYRAVLHKDSRYRVEHGPITAIAPVLEVHEFANDQWKSGRTVILDDRLHVSPWRMK